MHKNFYREGVQGDVGAIKWQATAAGADLGFHEEEG